MRSAGSTALFVGTALLLYGMATAATLLGLLAWLGQFVLPAGTNPPD